MNPSACYCTRAHRWDDGRLPEGKRNPRPYTNALSLATGLLHERDQKQKNLGTDTKGSGFALADQRSFNAEEVWELLFDLHPASGAEDMIFMGIDFISGGHMHPSPNKRFKSVCCRYVAPAVERLRSGRRGFPAGVSSPQGALPHDGR